MQFKLKVLKGDFVVAISILQGLGDVLVNFSRLLKNSNRLTKVEFKEFSNLPDTKIYWKPNSLK